MAWLEAGPDPAVDGVVRWRRQDLRRGPRRSGWSSRADGGQVPGGARLPAAFGAPAASHGRSGGEARERFAKNLWTERRSDARPLLVTVRDDTAQADYVCSEVLAAREAGIPLKAQAALFRAASHSAELELELTRRNVPFVKFGGLKFLEAAHVKDLLAILRFAENPRDRVAGSRVLELLPGIGEATAAETPCQSRRSVRKSRRAGDGAGAAGGC